MENPEHSRLVRKFYESFAALDAEAMVTCYHEDIVFSDPAFGTLKGARAGNMWRMLCTSQKGKDFEISFSDIQATPSGGSALWEARYTFSKTGRKVHNKIKATFEIRGGKIIGHKDDFDLKNWAAQALGFKGALLGGTNFFKRKLQAQTNEMLAKFEAKALANH